MKTIRICALCLIFAAMFTGCSKQETTEPPQIVSSDDALVYEGGSRDPEPTYANGSDYEPFGHTTEFTAKTDRECIDCTFLLPDENVSGQIPMDGYTTIFYESGFLVSYGCWENSQDAQENDRKLKEMALDIISSDDTYPTELVSEETSLYEGMDRQFQTRQMKAVVDLGPDKEFSWVYAMGTEASDSAYVFWVVEDRTNQFSKFRYTSENIMLSLEVIP